MKILLAPDSFKGTMSSIEIIDFIEEIAKKHFQDLMIVKVPIADGGEGTVDSLVTATGGEYRQVEVTGPLAKQRVKANFGIINGKTAVIEMAQASGLPLVPRGRKNPMETTTYGTGEVIKAALDKGIRDFLIGIGGSATNDGGIGAAQALGVRFLDSEKKDIGFGGQYLSKIKHIDTSGVDTRIKESRIIIICDVNNPLTGPKGATAIYGPQKGVTREMFEVLEAGMINYAKVAKKHLGKDIDNVPGAGAAGGLGAAFMGFFNASLKQGIETILDYVDFDKLLNDVDLVVTGEGNMDGQSVYGKVPVGISTRCKKRGIPVIAIVGGVGENAQAVYDYGIDSIITTVNRAMSLNEALSRSEELLKDAADRMFRLIKVGMEIKKPD